MDFPSLYGWLGLVPSTMPQPVTQGAAGVVLPDQATSALWSTPGPHSTALLGHLQPPWGHDTATGAAELGSPQCTCGWTHSHMPALLVMPRPHVTASARTQREEDRRECSVPPQTQSCCPSLTHIWGTQEKPAKSKHCAKLSVVSLAAQLPRLRDCQMGCSRGTLLLWPNAAPQASSLEHRSIKNLTAWLRITLKSFATNRI